VIYLDKRDRESNHDQDRPHLLHQRLGVGKHRLFCSGSQHLHVWSLPNATHLLTLLTFWHINKGFKFESLWKKMPGFKEVVPQAWTWQVHSNEKIRMLHIKL
jgi:hypothetical protein